MTLVAILEVRAGQLDAFRAFERQAPAVMATHGGRIERTVFIPPAEPHAAAREVHVVTFPDLSAFARYREDPRLRALASARDACIARTEVLLGEDGPAYP